MKASLSLLASDLFEARTEAARSFQQFFGDQPYRIVEESADSYLVDAIGEIKAWRCSFEAEEVGAR